ncbi:MAG: hypothetical protein AAF710_08655 [Planctomycetota bacterium]
MLAQAAQAPTVGGSGPWLVWGIVLLASAFALLGVETFLPTGGIVGALAGLAAIVGIIFLFRFNTALGLASATACLIALPFIVVFMLKIAPDTPFGKWITLNDVQASVSHPPPPPESGGVLVPAPDRPTPIAVGDTGVTLTPLFPVGTVRLHGRREECLAQRGTIDKGVEVRVVVVDGSEVHVTPV